MKRNIKIISLSDLITPDFNDTIAAFIQLCSEKNPTLERSTIAHAIHKIIPKIKSSIDSFNLGELSEESFTEEMLSILQKEADTLLTAEEFNHAWSAMYPEITTYKPLLEQAIDYHKQADQELIFISFTNPKDINHIVNQLHSNDIPHRIDKDSALCEIDTIPLHTSYSTKQTKSELLFSIIENINKSLKPRNVVSRMFQSLRNKQADITYIRCANTISDPTSKAELDQKNAELAQELTKLATKTLIWNKQAGESLSDVLQKSQQATLDQETSSMTMLCN